MLVQDARGWQAHPSSVHDMLLAQLLPKHHTCTHMLSCGHKFWAKCLHPTGPCAVAVMKAFTTDSQVDNPMGVVGTSQTAFIMVCCSVI